MSTTNKTKKQSESQWTITLSPGDILREKLAEMHLTMTAFAQSCQLSVKTVRDIAASRIQVTREIAEKLERGTLIPVGNWLKHERCYRESCEKAKSQTRCRQ